MSWSYLQCWDWWMTWIKKEEFAWPDFTWQIASFPYLGLVWSPRWCVCPLWESEECEESRTGLTSSSPVLLLLPHVACDECPGPPGRETSSLRTCLRTSRPGGPASRPAWESGRCSPSLCPPATSWWCWGCTWRGPPPHWPRCTPCRRCSGGRGWACCHNCRELTDWPLLVSGLEGLWCVWCSGTAHSASCHHLLMRCSRSPLK